jgi:flagellar hook assembly protein FlgD
MMDDTEVRVVDASGNLVKTIQSTGGSAVWDATNASGQRVSSGVYTALCNTKSGKGHGTVKVLIMN